MRTPSLLLIAAAAVAFAACDSAPESPTPSVHASPSIEAPNATRPGGAGETCLRLSLQSDGAASTIVEVVEGELIIRNAAGEVVLAAEDVGVLPSDAAPARIGDHQSLVHLEAEVSRIAREFDELARTRVALELENAALRKRLNDLEDRLDAVDGVGAPKVSAATPQPRPKRQAPRRSTFRAGGYEAFGD